MTGIKKKRVSNLDINHMRYFQAVAAMGSLTGAARQLGVSQPALSKAVRHLEARFETTLLLRNSRGVSLTEAGEAFLSCCHTMLATLETAEQQIWGLETEEVGHFHIGCYESLGAYFLPNFMMAFMEASPRIELSLWNASSGSVTDAVINREVHFGLVVNPIPHPDLVLLPLFPDAVRIMIKRARWQALAEATGLQDGHLPLEAVHEHIRASLMIYAGRVSQCQELLASLKKAAAFPTRELSCGDLELVKSFALSGLGLAILPERVASYGHEGSLVVLHPELPWIPDQISLLFRADSHRTRAFDRLKDALVTYGRALGSPDVTPHLNISASVTSTMG